MARGLSSFGREPRYWKDRNGQMWAVCIECDAAIKAEHAFWLPSDKAVRDVPACRDCALRAIEQWREDMECVTGEIGVKA